MGINLITQSNWLLSLLSGFFPSSFVLSKFFCIAQKKKVFVQKMAMLALFEDGGR